MSEGTQRKLAAIVFADVVGYSRLMGRDDAGTLRRLNAHRAEHVDPLIGEYGAHAFDYAYLDLAEPSKSIRQTMKMERQSTVGGGAACTRATT